MRRVFAWTGIAAAILTGVALAATVIQSLYADRQYRRLLARGEQALASGQAYSAVEAFSGALAFRPDSMVAYLRRGEAYRDQRRFDEAVRDWRQASRLAPDAPQPLVALGDYFDLAAQPAAAAEWYRQAADRLKGEDPGLLYRLALARFKAGDSAAAIGPLEIAAARQPTSAETRYLLGLVQRDVGDIEAAVKTLESAIALSEDLVAAREELADTYRALGRPGEEMAQLQALAARDPSVERRVAIGEAEVRNGQLDGALGTLTAALQSSPNDSRVLLAIGRVYLARAERGRGQDDEAENRAVEVIERALGGNAPRREGLTLYGRALYVAGQYFDAERILRDAVATSPVDAEAFVFLADAAAQLGHDEVARDALLNVDTLQGDTVSAAVRAARAARIGELSLRAGDAGIAADFLSRAVAAGHDSPIVIGRLAHARWLTGDAATARDLLSRALTASPRDPELLRIARIVR